MNHQYDFVQKADSARKRMRAQQGGRADILRIFFNVNRKHSNSTWIQKCQNLKRPKNRKMEKKSSSGGLGVYGSETPVGRGSFEFPTKRRLFADEDGTMEDLNYYLSLKNMVVFHLKSQCNGVCWVSFEISRLCQPLKAQSRSADSLLMKNQGGARFELLYYKYDLSQNL